MFLVVAYSHRNGYSEHWVNKMLSRESPTKMQDGRVKPVPCGNDDGAGFWEITSRQHEQSLQKRNGPALADVKTFLIIGGSCESRELVSSLSNFKSPGSRVCSIRHTPIPRNNVKLMKIQPACNSMKLRLAIILFSGSPPGVMR